MCATIEYVFFQSFPIEEPHYAGLCRLHDNIFAGQSSSSIALELQTRPWFLIQTATDAGEVVGYKIGYDERNGRFYSWLGGVNPLYRGQGIASELMRMQHEWCRDHKYKVIRTQTKNKWRDMLILNLRHGFDIVGTYMDEMGEPKIMLEKRL